MASRIVKKPPTTRTPRKPIIGNVTYNYNDPTTPHLIDQIAPPAKTKLPLQITGYVGGGQSPDSLAGQAASCLVTINNSLDFVSDKTKKPLSGWVAGGTLKILPRAGNDLNAYYDRRALKFFYAKDPVSNKLVFTCDSADVVSHELGHAILDIIRPDMWNIQSMEVWAFHEAYGDCNAIMTSLSQDRVLDFVLEETGGNLRKSNVVSRLSEQVGLTAYNLDQGKKGRNKEYLRNAVNSFNYIEPAKLTADTPDDQLSHECHNFSRVWTGTWYDFLVNIYEKHEKEMGQKKALQKARDVASHYLLHAIQDVPLTSRLFEALARQMLAVDGTMGRPYREELLHAFEKRSIFTEQVSILSAKKPKKIKLVKYIGVSKLSRNPLYYVNINVPGDEEGIDAALECVDYLHEKNLVGNDEKTPFEIKNNELIRTHIMCGCRSRNDCDPNAPEYGKGYKPQNNAGCCCKGIARTCGCESPEPTQRPKLGCYTSVKAGQLTRHRNGHNVSRKVC